jgi:ABC-2 type transport system ATP-binding protein
MIEAEGLTKRYGQTVALAGIDLQVPAGSILGVLGPNGAGKTTAVRILTTLSRPDSGWARVAGHDVVREAAAVQRNIGVTAQDATVDEVLTGRQNLVMIGCLSGLRRREARTRATKLLDQFDLTDAGGRILKEYSGWPARSCAPSTPRGSPSTTWRSVSPRSTTCSSHSPAAPPRCRQR